MKLRTVILPLAAFAAALLTLPAPALAVSAFARQYGMDCKTCHDVVPHRNEFGQAFEKAGYRWPVPRQEDPAKKKDDFLDISGIVSSVPLALTLSHAYTYLPDEKEDKVASDSLAQLHVAGSIADTVGFFAHNVLSSGEILSVVQLAPEHGLSLRVGKMTPTTTLRKPNQNFTYSLPAALAYSVTGEAALGAVRDALEIDLLAGNRGRIAVGSVDRSKQKASDYYGHASYKFGGVDYKGADPEVDLDKETSTWDFLAVDVGVFGYTGRTEDTDTRFNRWGAETEVLYRQLAVLLGWYGGRDETQGGDGLKIDSTVLAGEVDYRLSSDFHGALRVESEKIGNARDGDVVRIVGALQWIVRQNVILRNEWRWEDDDAKARTSGLLTLLVHI